MVKNNKGILVLIAARGGSKGVKGKNIRSLSGKPLIQYTIKQALEWGKGDHVVVSTDSVEIARIAKNAGAEVPFLRPPEFATDEAAKAPALRHAVIECESTFRVQYRIIFDLDVTAPIRTIQDLDNCLELFQKHQPKTLVSAVEARKNPYFNLVRVTNDGKVDICIKLDKPFVRRQDAPAVYALNGSIYVYQRDYVVNPTNHLPLTDDTRMYVMPDFSGVDIDKEIDFKFIEFLLKEKLVTF